MLKRLAAMSVEAARRYGSYLFFQQTCKQTNYTAQLAATLRDVAVNCGSYGCTVAAKGSLPTGKNKGAKSGQLQSSETLTTCLSSFGSEPEIKWPFVLAVF